MTDYSEIVVLEDLVKHRNFGHKESWLVPGAATHWLADCVAYLNNPSHWAAYQDKADFTGMGLV